MTGTGDNQRVERPDSVRLGSVCAATLTEMDALTLYRLLRLRSEVFVVEQHCVFCEPDGRDVGDNVCHVWIEQDADVVAVARIIDEGDHREIGRVATAPSERNTGQASRLIEHCLRSSSGPWKLAAQARLQDWYATFGFTATGEIYIEDGIEHIAMWRYR